MFTGTNRIIGETSLTNNLGLVAAEYKYLDSPIKQTYVVSVA